MKGLYPVDLLAVGLVTSVLAVDPPVAAKVHADAVAAEAGELVIRAGGENNVVGISDFGVASEELTFLSAYLVSHLGRIKMEYALFSEVATWRSH